MILVNTLHLTLPRAEGGEWFNTKALTATGRILLKDELLHFHFPAVLAWLACFESCHVRNQSYRNCLMQSFGWISGWVTNLWSFFCRSRLQNKYASVEQVLSDRSHNAWRVIRRHFPEDIRKAIALLPRPFKQQDDKRIWCISASGEFSAASVRASLQQTHFTYPHLKKIWKSCIPTRIGFFLWRLFSKCFSTDAQVRRISLCSRCQCC